jgi:hypothetical protein
MEESKRLTQIGIPKPYYPNDSIAIRKLEHTIDMDEKKIEIEQEEKKQNWRSCCFEIHADSSKFFAKLFVSTMVIALCIYQLINVQDCGSQHLYSSLLGIVLGAYLK